MLWAIFVTYIITHHGLIAAAISTLSMLISEPTAKKQCKEDIYVYPVATLPITKKILRVLFRWNVLKGHLKQHAPSTPKAILQTSVSLLCVQIMVCLCLFDTV